MMAAVVAEELVSEVQVSEAIFKTIQGMPGTVNMHTIFPKSFSNLFRKIGINVNDPRNGAWWDTQSHLRNSYEYNQCRKAFFSIEDVTAINARALAEFLAWFFGFDWGR